MDSSRDIFGRMIFVYRVGLGTVLPTVFMTALAFGQAPEIKRTDSTEVTVELKLPPDVELKVLVDYVSSRLGIRIIYDEQIANKKITIVAPGQMPIGSLLGVLESALKMKGLMLVDSGVPGWKRIEAVAKMPQMAVPASPEPPEGFGVGTTVTRAFTLVNITPAALKEIITPFLTPQGAQTIEMKENRVLIVTDFADQVNRIAELIRVIDRAGPTSVIEFHRLKNGTASDIAIRLTEILSAKYKAKEGDDKGVDGVQVSPNPRTNELTLVGPKALIDEAIELANKLDVSLGLVTRSYVLQYTEADRIDNLAKQFFAADEVDRLYRSTLDKEANVLVVQTTEQIHARIEQLRKVLDIPAGRTPSPVKFYKLRYADAEDVLETIQSIESGGSGSPASNSFQGVRGVSPLGRGMDQTAGLQRLTPVLGPSGPNQPPQFGPQPVIAPGLTDGSLTGSPQGLIAAETGVAEATNAFSESDAGAFLSLARAAADPQSNSIIVVGPAQAQRAYEELIKYLDRRRDQVLIEATVAIIDTSDDYALGIEFSTGDRKGDKKLLEFTSFGLSEVNRDTGALRLTPGRGFNWTLVNPDVADVVLRALSNHRRSRVMSVPRIVVNDNATGTLASVAEVPFTSVNASNTVATTSFAGFAEAGTTIEATPRISDDDLLILDFTVSLNSFTGTGSAGVPPPRQTDEIASSVTIPDGHTVIIGGLNRSNASLEHTGVPFAEFVPIIREFTGSETKSNSRATLFFFLRPTILRDDKFKDLKFISERDLQRAQIQGAFPRSAPILVR